jgi:two-component system sensor histidine kinase SenX3
MTGVSSDDEPASEALARRVVDTSRNGVAVLDSSGAVVLSNPRALELGLVSGGVADDRAAAAAGRVAASGRAVRVDLSPEVARGRAPRAVHGEARSLGDGCTVVDVVDASESVRLEKTRRDFVANVSHELQTPVGALALLAEAAVDAVDDRAEVARFCQQMHHEATRLGTLVAELLELSRLTGAERLPDLYPVPVDDVIAEAVARQTQAAQLAGITLEATGESGLCVLGDRPLLVTALANLIANAIAYSPAGSTVQTFRDESGGWVEIAVTDQGIGIAEKHQSRVFERFYRVDKARSRETGGTGLGLAIVKHVAANHGGEVTVVSTPGAGSRFSLHIPAVGGGSGGVS